MSSAQNEQISGEAKVGGMTAAQAKKPGNIEQPARNLDSAKTAKLKSTKDKTWTKEEDEPNRDLVTGRVIVDDGESCLRCTEKGLRCTLHFVGVEGTEHCAACKRSGSRYCIRQRPAWKRLTYYGPPWKNPNYFTVGDIPSDEEMEEILQEHFMGQQTYSHGTYLYEVQRKHMALPPFNGVDRPYEERMWNWKSADWKRVLPIYQNKSLHPRPATQSKDPTKEDGPEYISEGSIIDRNNRRKYLPRNMHVREYLNDVEETY
ncbi:hypothetical protein GGR54DRAFT_584542 [Hypoxylon sp. NC1633]|nr:hypothetical protein GGR54DRAFT_584542 [Hypoxylon sp. NC1633]